MRDGCWRHSDSMVPAMIVGLINRVSEQEVFCTPKAIYQPYRGTPHTLWGIEPRTLASRVNSLTTGLPDHPSLSRMRKKPHQGRV